MHRNYAKKKQKHTCKNIMIEEIDKSFINLSSIVSQHLLEKKKMDEDDFFGCTVACQLWKIELRKTELKGKIMKTLYEI